MVQVRPSLAALGLTFGVSTGTAKLMTSLAIYHRLSSQFIPDLQSVVQTNLTLQIGLLVDVVLQNHGGLDLLTAGKGGLCLCFYVNQPGIVKDKL